MSKKAERQHNMLRLPWVRKLKKPVKCDGIKYGTVAMKDLYDYGPGQSIPARGIQDKSRCKNNAWWHFKPLKKSYAKEGNYCWSHLLAQGVFGAQEEHDRMNKWYDKNGWEKLDD
jgi:hypothetical protein